MPWRDALISLAIIPGGAGPATPPPTAASSSLFLADWMIWLVTLLLALIGQVMVWRGLIGDRAKGRPHCWKCRYDMSGGDPANLTCSECGHLNKNQKKLF